MDAVIQQIRQFHQSPTTAKLRERLRQKPLLDIWGVGRRENGHSNFPAWLLAPAESHELGNFTLQMLLFLIATTRLTKEQQLPEALQYAILSGKNIISTAKIRREVSIPSTKDRVDIVIDIELTEELEGIQRLKYVCRNSNGYSTNSMCKGRIVLHVIKSYVEETNCTYEQLKNTFSPKWFGKTTEEKIRTRPKRFFLSDDELITMQTGEQIAVSSQCGKGKSIINFDNFVKKAEELGFSITPPR